MAIKTHFPADNALIEGLSHEELGDFEKWFVDLNKLNKQQSRVFYNGVNLEESTGLTCWYDYFTDGLTPAEALDEDFSHA